MTPSQCISDFLWTFDKNFFGGSFKQFQTPAKLRPSRISSFCPKDEERAFFSKAAKDTLQTPAYSFTGFIVGQIGSKSLKNYPLSEANRGQRKHLLLENF